MQFLLTAYDGDDPEALTRRLKVREEHLSRIGTMKKEGEFLFGGAILDENGKMIGSMIVYDFPDLKSLEESLKYEPYLTEEVWKKTEIKPFRVARFD